MCFTVKKEFKTRESAYNARKPKIAKEDITVYKCLYRKKGKFESPYINFIYKRGKTFKSKFSFECRKKHNHYHYPTVWILEIYEGLHSYRTRKIALECGPFGSHAVVKMIVPKGTKYFINDDEIVSNKLKFPNL